MGELEYPSFSSSSHSARKPRAPSYHHIATPIDITVRPWTFNVVDLATGAINHYLFDSSINLFFLGTLFFSPVTVTVGASRVPVPAAASKRAASSCFFCQERHRQSTRSAFIGSPRSTSIPGPPHRQRSILSIQPHHLQHPGRSDPASDHTQPRNRP